jgi:pSer/pThr/pTyr-binding forkhead associated (FHA) protein
MHSCFWPSRRDDRGAMKFALRLGHREFELAVGRFVIGRADGCELPLDDPLTSRQHAALAITDEQVTLDDLGSRNGVSVNGVRVTGSRILQPGDTIRIGKVELNFGLRRELGTETLVQSPTQRLPAFGLIGMLADKALALGRGDEAERILGPQLDHLLADAKDGQKLDSAVAERAAEYALKIAGLTGSRERVDTVFRIYAHLRRPCPSVMVEELYAVMRKIRQPNRTELRRYLDILRGTSVELGPADRFLVSRLEGLERSLG